MAATPFDVLSAGYDFLAPPRIAFGWGQRCEVGKIARTLGERRAFVVSGSRTLSATGAVDEIAKSLSAAGLAPVAIHAPSHEPEVADVDRLVAHLREQQAAEGDVMIAIGGGSTIDLAKAAAALVTNTASTKGTGTSVVDYLEGVGRGLAITRSPLPLLAMPTTGGTGTEATKNAVISSYDPPFKKSLRSDLMVPRAVLVDPELSVSLPASITAACGMDAITQCLESYISRRAKPIARALAAEGLRRAVPAIVTAVSEPTNRAAREAMAHAALLSGMALANSGLGLAHGVAAALGVLARTRHGLACAVMLPAALVTNRPHCEHAMAELARLVWNDSWSNDAAAADALVARIEELCRAVNVPRRLRDIDVQREQIPALVRASHGNSLDGNPVTISDEQLQAILERMW
ncbi:MAG TPA: iron-containing alcohol dehydrogenase [Pirellulales bacterium]|nr:iron-containing alcohol dehydrogenase [Pirellulales bacterium]